MSLVNTADLHVGQGNPHRGDRYVWTQPDRAEVLVQITRIHDGVVWLRCHHGGRTWTRRHPLPLYPSMRRHDWTLADLLDLIDRGAPEPARAHERTPRT